MKKTRIYEVPAEMKPAAEGAAPEYNKTYLVEASSRSAAERHISDKYVGEASLPQGKRLADLMASGIKVELAAESDGD